MCGTSTLSKLSHHWPNTRKHWPVPHRPAHSWTNPPAPAPQQPAGLDRSAEHFTPDAPIPQWTRSHYMLYISFTWKQQKTKSKEATLTQLPMQFSSKASSRLEQTQDSWPGIACDTDWLLCTTNHLTGNTKQRRAQRDGRTATGGRQVGKHGLISVTNSEQEARRRFSRNFLPDHVSPAGFSVRVIHADDWGGFVAVIVWEQRNREVCQRCRFLMVSGGKSGGSSGFFFSFSRWSESLMVDTHTHSADNNNWQSQ